MQVLTNSGLRLDATEYAGTLPEVMRTRLLAVIANLSSVPPKSDPLVVPQGPGRFIASIPDESNRLVQLILITDEVPDAKPSAHFPPRLLFYPIDLHQWKIDSREIWVGRPGEEVFVIPNIVQNVLELIRRGSASRFYQRNADGSYAIHIPDKNIRGSAVWR